MAGHHQEGSLNDSTRSRFRVGRAAVSFAAALCSAVIHLASPPAAWADLYALGDQHATPYAVIQYGPDGRFLRGNPGVAETTDALTSTGDGWVYVAGNGLGNGALARSRVEGPLAWKEATPFIFGGEYTLPGPLAAGPDNSIYAISEHFFA